MLLCSSVGQTVDVKAPHMEHPEYLLSKEARIPKMFFAAQSWLSAQTLHSHTVGFLQAEMLFSENLSVHFSLLRSCGYKKGLMIGVFGTC